jgi:hypothetical protein
VNASKSHANVSGRHEIYLSHWQQVLEANRSTSNGPQIWSTLLNTLGSSIHSALSLVLLDSNSARTMSFPGMCVNVHYVSCTTTIYPSPPDCTPPFFPPCFSHRWLPLCSQIWLKYVIYFETVSWHAKVAKSMAYNSNKLILMLSPKS